MNNRRAFELTTPGTWVDLPDPDASWEVQTQVVMLQSVFAELSLALHLFDQDLENVGKDSGIKEWQAHASRRVELMWESLSEAGVNEFGGPDLEGARELGARRAWMEKFAKGILPRELRFAAPFLHAKAFLQAADAIGKIMTQLGKRNDVPTAVKAEAQAFFRSFPTLTDVRDSVQHIEDRGRGVRKGGVPIRLQPVVVGPISAPSGALILNHLNGRSFGMTLADGSYGEVHVTEESLKRIRDHLEALLGALPWKGAHQLFPS